MPKGALALVLHAHLPYVRSAKTGSLEEDWYFQALMECYLPLLKTIENSANKNEQNPKLTIGLSPTLLSLLEAEELKNRFPEWLAIRLEILKNVSGEKRNAALFLSKRIQNQLIDWESCNGNLINRFTQLERSGVIDLLTCAATHGYLPLLRETPEAIYAQLKTATREHFRIFGITPLGIWLPECAYYEGLDQIMIKAGLRYAVLDGHGLLNANPRPRYGIYAPICTKNGVAFFGRDSESTLPVWSAKSGYPGDSKYREFHRDVGWELSKDQLKNIGLDAPRPLGLKLHRVTSLDAKLEDKEIYDPESAKETTKKHAIDFLRGRKKQLELLNQEMETSPILVAPFDAELFGHWWFEGPDFLSEVFAQAPKEKIHFTRLRDFLSLNQKLQLCCPSPSSWGQGGYHDYWLNEKNAWIIPKWNKAAKKMIYFSKIDRLDNKEIRIIKQAARELLLSQSSDWSFILRAGTTTKLARERIELHLERFWELINILENRNKFNLDYLTAIEKEDYIFPLINPNDWSQD